MNNKTPLLIGGAAVIIIAVVAAAFLFLPGLGGAGEYVILAAVDSDDDADLTMLQFGEDERDAIELIDDAQVFGCEFATLDNHSLMPIPTGIGFIPGSRDAFFCIEEDDEIHVMRMGPRDEEPTTILEADGWVTGYIDPANDRIILIEDRGDQERCYLSQNWEEADRIAKGDTCQPVLDGSAVITADYDSDGLSLAITDIRRGDETQLLDEEPTFDEFQVSFDGTRIALIENDEGEYTLRLMETSEGEFIAESDDYIGVYTYGFTEHENSAYAIAENEDGLVLLVLDANRFAEIAEGEGLQALPDPSGRFLVYQVMDEDGESEIFSYDFAHGESHRIYDGEQIQFAITDNIDRIVILEQDEDEFTIYSAPFNGGDVIELINVDDIAYLDIYTYADDGRLFISSYGEDGMSLYITSANQDDGYLLLDEWASFEPLRMTSKHHILAFSGLEDDGDDLTLFAIPLNEDAQALELDDDMEEIFSSMVIFSANEREIIYTVMTGDDIDDLEIRSVRVDGNDSPATIYEESLLAAAGWYGYDFFQPVSFTQIIGAVGATPPAPPIEEPIAPETPSISGSIRLGQTIVDEITTPGGDYWFYDGQSGETITIMLNGIDGLDTVVEFMDSNYRVIASDDDGGEGRNSLLDVTLTRSGQHIIHARGYGNSTGEYALMIMEGSTAVPTQAPVVVEPTVPVDSPDSVILMVGTSVRGRTTTQAGDRWSLQLSQGDLVSIAMDAVDEMDTYLVLLDPSGNEIGTNDDGGEGLNSLLITWASESGTYTVVARGFGGDMGDYTLAIEDVSYSREGSLISELASTGSINQEQTIGLWTFEGAAGDIVAITMNSLGGLDPYLSFYDPDFIELDSNDDGGAGTDSLIFFNLLSEDGTYYVLASAYSGSGSYEITLHNYTPANDTIRQAGDTYTNTLTDVIGNVEAIRGSSGDVISIAMTAIDEMDPVIGLFDADWNFLIADDDSGGDYNALISGFEFPADGLIYLVEIALDDALGDYQIEIVEGVRSPVE